MLVLTRKLGQSIEIAGQEIVVRVIGLSKTKVQLGIEAPEDVSINRSERLEKESRCKEETESQSRSSNSPISGQRTSIPTVSREVVDELCRIEAEMAALAELASPKDRQIARRVAAESIERIAGMKRTIRIASRSQTERPLSEFLKSRADLIALPVSDKVPTLVRQTAAEYSVSPTQQACVA
jgi:carbon storage regulator